MESNNEYVNILVLLRVRCQVLDHTLNLVRPQLWNYILTQTEIQMLTQIRDHISTAKDIG